MSIGGNMAISAIAVQNVRSHKEYTITLESKKTIIVGPNGSGKTSLVEALYIACRGTSFKGTAADLIRTNSEWFRVRLLFDDGSHRQIQYHATDIKKREYSIDGKKLKRLRFSDKLPIVLFEPSDLQLVSGSPARRRRYLDQILSQSDPLYGRELARYEKSLRQRNLLLKRGAPLEQLFSWNVMLAQYGSYIHTKRAELVNHLQQHITPMYKAIATAEDTIALDYSIEMDASTYQSTLLRHLEQNLERDRLLGATSAGPHREDMKIIFNGKLADTVASRGEVRSIIIALKYIELEVIHQATGILPILILDDVFSELDATRQLRLEQLTSRYQTITTTTHLSDQSDQAIQRQLS